MSRITDKGLEVNFKEKSITNMDMDIKQEPVTDYEDTEMNTGEGPISAGNTKQEPIGDNDTEMKIKLEPVTNMNTKNAIKQNRIAKK